MIIFYANKNNSNHVRILQAFHDSYEGTKYIYPTEWFNKNIKINRQADIIVFAGIIRGEGAIYKWCQDNGKRFLYIDHAYINRGYNGAYPDQEWMRITDSDFVWNKMEHRGQDRWDGSFKNLELGRWDINYNKPNILVLPPSTATQYIYPESKTWLERAVRVIKDNSNKNIVIREKPIQMRLTAENTVESVMKFKHEKTIEAELQDAYRVVTFNSAVAVQATIMGIPAHCSQEGAAAPVRFQLNLMDGVPEPNRQAWLNQLMYHQFRTSEIADGTVWRLLEIP